MIDFKERPNNLPWPPFIYGGALLLGSGLEMLLPIEALDRILAELSVWVGIAVIICGTLVDGAAMLALRRHGTTVMPNAGTQVLATAGIYGLSRNPIYLGNTIALLGIALALRWSWLLLLVPVTMAAVVALAIAREERHLELRFGDVYRVYKARVRRWI
jgi:protein-S-isoprenylcysteine O-methyltransferase Ste14